MLYELTLFFIKLYNSSKDAFSKNIFVKAEIVHKSNIYALIIYLVVELLIWFNRIVHLLLDILSKIKEKLNFK